VEFEDYYRITDDCDDCQKCIKACPNFAIAKTVTIGQRLEQRAHSAPETEDDE
jgi:epoxyqueuosine reductase QueG